MSADRDVLPEYGHPPPHPPMRGRLVCSKGRGFSHCWFVMLIIQYYTTLHKQINHKIKGCQTASFIIMLDSRRVLVGTPSAQGAGAKHISNPHVAPFLICICHLTVLTVLEQNTSRIQMLAFLICNLPFDWPTPRMCCCPFVLKQRPNTAYSFYQNKPGLCHTFCKVFTT